MAVDNGSSGNTYDDAHDRSQTGQPTGVSSSGHGDAHDDILGKPYGGRSGQAALEQEMYVVPLEKTPPSDPSTGQTINFVHHEHENLHEFVAKARQVATFSICFTIICACTGFAFAWRSNSSSLMAYSFGTLVNVCSSVLVLWRFWNDPDGEGQYFEITRRRERRASVGVGFTFVAIGLATFIQSIVHLAQHNPPTDSEVLLIISSISMFVLSWSCVAKLYLAAVLQSTALRKDAIVSGACAVLAGTVLFSTAIYNKHPKVWWLDATIALIVSLILPLLGVQALTRNRWWNASFWKDDDLPAIEKVGPEGGMLPSEAAELNAWAYMLSDHQTSAAVQTPSSRK